MTDNAARPSDEQGDRTYDVAEPAPRPDPHSDEPLPGAFVASHEAPTRTGRRAREHDHEPELAAPRPSFCRRLGRVFMFIVRVLLGSLFIFSGSQKLLDPQSFVNAIIAFEILPEKPDLLLQLATYGLPWSEIVAGVFLVLGVGSRGAALFITLLMLVFTGAIVSVLVRGLDVECGCFGAWLPSEVTNLTPLRNGAILLPALLVLAFGGGWAAVDRHSRR
jgi:putative oxidoreductase